MGTVWGDSGGTGPGVYRAARGDRFFQEHLKMVLEKKEEGLSGSKTVKPLGIRPFFASVVGSEHSKR